ncbi:hypothetical protein NDU88_000594 [Pleurodeles waltl]|uniref:Uncharacterized protein n=1 Tax=Pleurodeles waltl TaxID=8319 RepID=A0AAV7KNR8_PLEWA|nr:hypothetical protein NDU88_000594 [Pleurodeles waltl]
METNRKKTTIRVAGKKVKKEGKWYDDGELVERESGNKYLGVIGDNLGTVQGQKQAIKPKLSALLMTYLFIKSLRGMTLEQVVKIINS